MKWPSLNEWHSDLFVEIIVREDSVIVCQRSNISKMSCMRPCVSMVGTECACAFVQALRMCVQQHEPISASFLS